MQENVLKYEDILKLADILKENSKKPKKFFKSQVSKEFYDELKSMCKTKKDIENLEALIEVSPQLEGMGNLIKTDGDMQPMGWWNRFKKHKIR
jgi:cell fate (sporulation/competence/biofilm development) regulator YmcA (YheA/YmcA/DUF963 family)